VTDEGAPIAAACLHPHPALRATFPRLGEGFRSGKPSAKNKSIRNEIRWFSKAKVADAFLVYMRQTKTAPKS
jgi:hypothetical protein